MRAIQSFPITVCVHTCLASTRYLRYCNQRQLTAFNARRLVVHFKSSIKEQLIALLLACALVSEFCRSIVQIALVTGRRYALELAVKEQSKTKDRAMTRAILPLMDQLESVCS